MLGGIPYSTRVLGYVRDVTLELHILVLVCKNYMCYVSYKWSILCA